jgi:type I restriction enzyme S subunit
MEISEPTTFESSIIRARPDSTRADSLFLYYMFSSPQGRYLLGTILRQVAVSGITGSDLIKLIVPRPPRKQQQAIACILGALDDKIELNRRMNRTLEATARAIFKSWFVDFEPVRAKTDGRVTSGLAPRIADLFPDSFEDSELGKIPKGWEIGSILKIADLLSGGTPKTSVEEYWNGDILWASAKDVSQCGEAFLIRTERKISELGLTNSSTKIIPAFSSVVVARGATTGRMAMFGSDIAMNQTCYALTSRDGMPFFLHCHFRYFVNALVFSAHGSVFDTITTRTFQTTDTIIPAEKVRKSFDMLVKPLFLKILGNQNESIQLSDLRDTLLPKLISGDLRVPDAERIVGRCVCWPIQPPNLSLLCTAHGQRWRAACCTSKNRSRRSNWLWSKTPD